MTAKRSRKAGRPAEQAAEDFAEDAAGVIGVAGRGGDDDQADADLAELGVQLPEGAVLTLYRQLEGGDKEFLDEQPVAGFTVASVAARFGGGRYIAYLKKPHPEVAGRWFKAGSKAFRIGGPSRYNVPDAAAVAPAAAASVADADLARSYGELIQNNIRTSIESAQMMQAMQMALLKSMTDRPAPAPDSSMELLKVLLPTMVGARSDHLTVADVIALADRMANKTAPTTQLKETLEMVTALRELSGEGGGSGPAWMPIASRALGLLEHAQQYNPRQLPAGDVDDAAPAHPPAAGAPTPAEEPIVPENAHPLFKFLAPQLPGLIKHAQADHDPDTYAGMLVDMIGEEHWPSVVAYLDAPDFMQQLRSYVKLTAAVDAWFEELRSCVVDQIKERQQPAEPDPNAPADES